MAIHGITKGIDSSRRGLSRLRGGLRMLGRGRRGHSLPITVFEVSDWPGMEMVYGAPVDHDVVASISREFERIAPQRGWAVRANDHEFMVVLPKADRDQALRAIRATVVGPCDIELEIDSDEMMLGPELATRLTANRHH